MWSVFTQSGSERVYRKLTRRGYVAGVIIRKTLALALQVVRRRVGGQKIRSTDRTRNPGGGEGGGVRRGVLPPSDVLIGALISDTLNFLSYAIFGFISLTRSFCRSDKVPAGARGVPRQYSCCSTSNCRRTMRSRARVCETG